jgi:hypothetical protein
MKHQIIWDSEGLVPGILILEVDGSEGSTGSFISVERASGTHFEGGWLGPRADLDADVQRKIYAPCREYNPGSSAFRQ